MKILSNYNFSKKDLVTMLFNYCMPIEMLVKKTQYISKKGKPPRMLHKYTQLYMLSGGYRVCCTFGEFTAHPLTLLKKSCSPKYLLIPPV